MDREVAIHSTGDPAAAMTRRASAQVTVKLTVAQALIRYLQVQYSKRDGVRQRPAVRRGPLRLRRDELSARLLR